MRKKNELQIALIVFGLTWAGIARAEDQRMAQQTKPNRSSRPRRVGGLLQAGTASSISCSKTVMTSEHCRILCADLSADAAVISTYLKSVPGPVVLAGHSYAAAR